MANFQYFSGTIREITDFWTGNEQTTGCYKFMSLQDEDGNIVNFIVAPNTYFVDHATMSMGDAAIGFYDADLPVALIFPPQYQAVVMARASLYYNVKVDYFDTNLVSGDGMLRLNLSPSTRILLENNQSFTGNPANRNLIVLYSASTRSIPAQTTPHTIIVMC